MKRVQCTVYLIGIGLIIGLCLIGCDNGTNGNYEGDEEHEGATLVCLGDSLTAGYGASIPGEDDLSKSYPAFLESRITIPVINAGITGDTTSDAVARLEGDVLSENPRMVIITLGANDVFQGITPEKTRSNLQTMITRLKDTKTKIFLAKFYTEAVARTLAAQIGITDTTFQTLFIKQYDDMFAKLASENNIELIDDIWAGVWGVHMSDPIHPNAAGYEIMADTYFNAIKPYLEKHNLRKQ